MTQISKIYLEFGHTQLDRYIQIQKRQTNFKNYYNSQRKRQNKKIE